MKLSVAHVISSTEAEGPGLRTAVWVQGCTLRCPSCCNPELFTERGGTPTEPSALAEVVLRSEVEGLSVLGGEPFEQPEALAEVCERVQHGGKSVMIYSGFTLSELRSKASPHVERALAHVDLLVDGRYEAAHPDSQRRWVGSTNQVLHFLTERYRPDDPRFRSPNTVELRWDKGQLVINGWPSAADALRRR